MSVSVTAPRRTLSSSNPVCSTMAARSASRNVSAGDVSWSSLRPSDFESSSVVTEASALESSFQPNTAFKRRLPRPVEGSAARRRRRFESVCEFKSASETENSRVNLYSVDPSARTGHGGTGGSGDGGGGNGAAAVLFAVRPSASLVHRAPLSVMVIDDSATRPTVPFPRAPTFVGSVGSCVKS